MSNNSNSSNSTDSLPTNLVEFECQETKHKFGLDKYPDISTDALVVAARNIINSMDAPSHSRQTDCQYLSLQYWALMCVELLAMRIRTLYNRIDNCGK